MDPRWRAKSRFPRGFSLVEVVIAILLTAVITVSVMVVAISVKRGSNVNERKLAANEYIKQVNDTLKNYVTASLALAPGPGDTPGGCGCNNWHLPGDACNTYALGAGCVLPNCPGGAPCHDLTASLLPLNLRTSGVGRYGMTLTYTVVDRGGCGAIPCATFAPEVKFSVNWNEPQ